MLNNQVPYIFQLKWDENLTRILKCKHIRSSIKKIIPGSLTQQIFIQNADDFRLRMSNGFDDYNNKSFLMKPTTNTCVYICESSKSNLDGENR